MEEEQVGPKRKKMTTWSMAMEKTKKMKTWPMTMKKKISP